MNGSCHFGAVEFEEAEEIGLSSRFTPTQKVLARRSCGKWKPPARLSELLPRDFSVPIICITGRDGARQFFPALNQSDLIDLGSVGGLAVLHGIRDLDPEIDYSYRAAHQIVRFVRRMREHLDRQFMYSRDLFVRWHGRISPTDRSVLPGRISPRRLCENGRRFASAAGCDNPASWIAIHFGLIEEARRNPLHLSPGESRTLLRLALYNLEDGTSGIDPTIVEIVTERLLMCIHHHLDQPAAEFDAWFLDGLSSVVKQIAKQKRARGGQVETTVVRKALLQIGWSAYAHCGDCIHLLMQTVKNSMMPGLSNEEVTLFEQMHERQPYFGDLPFVLLAERAEFLWQVLLDVLGNPPKKAESIPTLHRMLALYEEMSSARRDADRRSKRAASVRAPD